MTDELKQVILVRDDLKLPKGKLAVQVAHASVDATLKSPRLVVEHWRREGMMKTVLKVSGETELHKFVQLAIMKGLITAVITDAGRTVVEPGTTTCAAIGPAPSSTIDDLTGALKLV